MQRWLRSPDGMTPETIANLTAFLDAHATDAIDPANILTFGSSWGGLYAMLTGQTMPAGLRFHVNETDPDVVPWLELVRDGTFSTATLALLPTSYNVSRLLQFNSSVFYHPSLFVRNRHPFSILSPRLSLLRAGRSVVAGGSRAQQ